MFWRGLLWLAFASTSEPTRGRWVHKPCVDGQAAELFNTPHIVMMRGLEAIRQLAEALNTSVE